MEFNEAKQKYIQAWGSLGSSWGINRTMAQIHALLLISPEPLSTEDIMEELKVSRGNVNMNVRTLIDWGMAEKVLVAGERKEFFKSEKDIMSLAVQIAKERKRRELDPLIKVLNETQNVEGKSPASKEFKKVNKDLLKFAKQAEGAINVFMSSNQSWFFRILSKLKG